MSYGDLGPFRFISARRGWGGIRRPVNRWFWIRKQFRTSARKRVARSSERRISANSESMKLLRRLATLVWVTTLLVAGCILYLFNSDPVIIDFVWLQIPETSLAVVLINIFCRGCNRQRFSTCRINAPEAAEVCRCMIHGSLSL